MYGVSVAEFLRTVSRPIRARWNKYYHRNPRVYSFQGVSVNVLPGVYSPISSTTTETFLEYIQALDLNQKTVLELGCGSGIISRLSAQKGALVTASDICETALDELRISARNNADNIIAVYSNVFENLPFGFDYVFINPPYIPKKSVLGENHTNCCGEDFDFFNTLFLQLKQRNLKDTQVLMILPEEAEVFAISRRAQLHFLKLSTVKVWNKKGQRIALYRILLAD